MSKTPDYDTGIEKILSEMKPGPRTCALTGEAYELTDEELSWCQKFKVPPSNFSPLTRLRILTGFFVGYQWWNNKSAKDGQALISTNHPASGVKVLSDEEWFGEDFSRIYRDDDPSRSVFDLIRELELEIPFTALRNTVPPINSISTISMGDENSYFMNACRSKNSFFAMNAIDVEHSAEIYQSQRISDSYNIIHSDRIHRCCYVMESRDCLNSVFLFDCRNCEDCFMATNKRNKKFVFKNQQLSENEYRLRLSEIDLTCRSAVENQLNNFYDLIKKNGIWPENFNEQAVNSVGEYLTKVTNCRMCYWNANDVKNNLWCGFVFDGSEGNAFSVGWFTSQNSYYSTTGRRSSNILFSFLAVQCQNIEYCLHCYNCENCFGCVGLNRKKFCIFNKEYSEGEYWRKVDEIKCRMLERGEYGEFFPVSFSPTRFMDSGAALFYLADDQIARKLGATDYPPESSGASGEDRVPASSLKRTKDIPDCLSDPSLDDWIGKPIFDEEMRRRFVFLPQEIAFYKVMKIAPPNRHFIARVRDLGWRANSGQFLNGSCAKCGTKLLVTKNKTFPDRIIYCRKCYLTYLEQQG